MKKLLVFVLLCAPVLALAQQAAADKPAALFAWVFVGG